MMSTGFYEVRCPHCGKLMFKTGKWSEGTVTIEIRCWHRQCKRLNLLDVGRIAVPSTW